MEVVDDTAAWIVTGLAIAALFSPDTLPGVFGPLPPHVDVLGFALLGLPLYVCASGATPLAAALIFAGASPGAAVAFLLAGPASNVTTLGILSKMHGKGQAWLFGGVVVVLSVVLGVGVNMVLGLTYSVPLAAAGTPGGPQCGARGVCAGACGGVPGLDPSAGPKELDPHGALVGLSPHPCGPGPQGVLWRRPWAWLTGQKGLFGPSPPRAGFFCAGGQAPTPRRGRPARGWACVGVGGLRHLGVLVHRGT